MVDLQVKDVARLLNVSEDSVNRWVEEGDIPYYDLKGEPHFDRTEIETWMLGRQAAFPTDDPAALFEKSQAKAGINQFSLFRALHRGDVLCSVPGDSKEEIIRTTMRQMAGQFDLDADVLAELLLDRERLMSTGLGHGIAIPHTRDFLLKRFDVVTVVFPEQPINFDAIDGQPVHTLFFLFACHDQRHLNLLAKIAHLSSTPAALELLQTQPDKAALLQFLKEWETQLNS